MIAELCSFIDLAILSRMCKPAARAVYNDRRRRINLQVAPFVGNRLEELRTTLQINRALLTGSVILRVLVDYIDFTPSGLTIVVPPGSSAMSVITFVKSLGYEPVPRNLNAERDRIHTGLYSATDWRVGQITTYIRPGDMKRIEVVRSSTPYAMDAVLAHPNTLLQNFATGTTLGCLYPSLTLHGHAMAIDPEVPNNVVAEQLVKYKRRGFSIHANNSYFAAACGAKCPTISRRADDPGVCMLHYWALYDENDVRDGCELPPMMSLEHLAQMRPLQEFRASSYCANPLCGNCNV